MLFQLLLIGSIYWQLFPSGKASLRLDLELAGMDGAQIKADARALKEKWSDLLGDDKLRPLFEELDQFCDTHQLESDTLILLQNQWKKKEKDEATNLISTQQAQQQHAKVIKGLIDFIDEITR